jgi:ABC-type glycerol-3-phosphate transport system substrate-binding protein
MARALNRGSGPDRQRYGLMVTGRKTNAAISESWGNVVYANGGRFVNDAGSKWVLNSREGLATMEWIVDLQTRQGVHPEVDYYLAQNVLDRTLFQQGRLGMLIQGEFLSRYLYGNQQPAGGIPFGYDVAQLPFGAGKTKRASVYNGNGLVMIRGTKQPDGVWQWLHVCSSQEAQQQITNLWGSRGAHQGTYETWLKDGGGGGPAGLNYQAIVKTAGYALSYPVSPYLNQADLVNACTTILYEQVFVRQLAPADGLRQMETEINSRLQAAGAP